MLTPFIFDSQETMGANMRLGARWVEFTNPEQSLAASLYGHLAATEILSQVICQVKSKLS